jgi:transcriptional regulator with XRE-family HTH domain
LRLRNDAAVSARERLGLSQVELAARAGVKQQHVSGLETLRFRSCPLQALERLSAVLGVAMDVLIPPTLMGQTVASRFEMVKTVDPGRMLGFSAGPKLLEAPMEREEMETAMDKMLGELEPRERDIIERRFGIGQVGGEQTLEEIGKRYGLTKERVRQIEANTVEKLKEPKFSSKLRIEVETK